jgi:DnaK suppressor protein
MASHLTAKQKQQLQAGLLARRAALERQRSRHLEGGSRAEHARELLLQDGDDASQRDADREVDLARVDRDAVELAEIGQALERLASGHYGLCVGCGEPIAPARLQLAPQAARCVACESLRERGSPRPARL